MLHMLLYDMSQVCVTCFTFSDIWMSGLFFAKIICRLLHHTKTNPSLRNVSLQDKFSEH